VADYQVLANGDLVIRDVSWTDNMGLYQCVAENTAGSDRVDVFLYPVKLHIMSQHPPSNTQG